MIVCPNCQRENEDEYKYCLGCGTVLPRPEKKEEPKPDELGCSNCGAAIPPNFKFCGECGTPVGQAATGATATAESHPRQVPTDPEPPPVRASPTTITGSPATIGHLVVIKPDGTEGAKIPIHEGEVKLGRDSEYEVLASDPFLSPHHASLMSDGTGHLLRDADSLNGVFIRITTEVELQDGDFIRLGQELLRFNAFQNVEPIVAESTDETLSGGSPEQNFWGRLSLVSGPDMESRGFVFSDDEVLVGREVGDILFREDGFVSGRHARIARVEGRAYLKDLGSSNGTYVRLRGERHVGNGDLILMGQQLFRVEV